MRNFNRRFMHIYQRLKELDPKTFEQFCVQLLKERHPGLDIKHVDGSAGDPGGPQKSIVWEQGVLRPALAKIGSAPLR
jgi:hypothetical protein